MWSAMRPAAILFLALTVITGVIYPFVVTGIAQAVFPHQANGSLIRDNDAVVGSELIGQPFDTPNYFWGRLSATTPYAYNAEASNGSNYGPMNSALLDEARKRIAKLQSADPGNTAPIPVDLVTASASGLDPEISRAAADYQVERVARSRGLPISEVRQLVAEHTIARSLGFFGEPRINVLELNRALDSFKSSTSVP